MLIQIEETEWKEREFDIRGEVISFAKKIQLTQLSRY